MKPPKKIHKILEFAIRLRDELHGFRELFDENDPSSGKLIQEFDDFLFDKSLKDD